MALSSERLFDSLGHFGRFQACVYFASVFQAMSCGIHYLASVFMAVTPNFVCGFPGNVSSVLFHNSSASSIEDIWTLWTSTENYVVVQLGNGEIWELDQCSRSKREVSLDLAYEYKGNKSVFPCSDGFLYDDTKWKSTVVTQWDLVCDREWLAKLIQPMFMLGVLIGAVIFGDIADRLGRQRVIWFTSAGQFVFGIAVAFTFDYYSFVIVRFLLAMVSSGYLVVAFVYVTEFVGIKARTWASMHVHAFFAMGIMIVALVGFLVRTWWVYQIFLSIATIPFVLCCWMLPETPFWLLSEERYEDAQKVIDTMARWNKVSTPCKVSELCSVQQDDPASSRMGDDDTSSAKKHNILDLFCNWQIARRTITVWLIWFTGSLGYYVFSLSSVSLGGNEYLNLFLIGAVELPCYIIACVAMDKLGRRNTLIPFLILSALICVLIMFIPQDFNILIILANMAGKFSIGVAFGLIYLYTAELYPTIVRSLAVGSGSMMCRVGSVVAPFCVYLRSVWIFMPLVGTCLLWLCILEMASPKVAVVGAGVIGLSTALCITETCPSCSVTVLSDQFSPNTTSDVAAGMLIPHTYPDTPIHRQKQWFKETFTYLFAISNSAEASEAGIHLVSGWQIFKSTPKEELPFWSDIVLGFRPMSETELQKFPQHRFGQAFTTLKCDCPPYLLWLEKRLKATGTQMYTRKVADLWELHSEYDIVVNCTGIGAQQLVGDKQLFPVRGQVLKVYAPWVKQFIRDGDGLTYIYPGIHKVTLGGTREKGIWSLSPDAYTTRDIFDRCCSLEPSLQAAQDIKVKVGLRPSRQCVRLQTEVLSQGGVKLPVVHNYGHGAGGFSVHRGTAKEAAHLVEVCISALQGSSSRAKL
ncbi:solute carrier family 22 member 16 isoform X1 [Lonchura striata]